jgi:D-xylose transport system permease protein
MTLLERAPAPTPASTPGAPEPPKRVSIWRSLAEGELVAVRVVIMLAVIWVIFQAQNDRFLSAENLTNLTLQIAAIGLISTGVVLVLLLGEIDLSVGAVSGLCAGVMAVLTVKHGWPPVAGIGAALALGALIGTFNGFMVTRFGIPSFVVTLAGSLAWTGALLWVLGDTGTINLPNDIITDLAGTFYGTGVAIAVGVLGVGGFAAISLRREARRRKAGLESRGVTWLLVSCGVVGLAFAVAIYIFAQDRGLPLAVVILVGTVMLFAAITEHTMWGRHLYAVGGNIEAARRAGIAIDRVRVIVFALASMMAAAGGVMAASRLYAVNQSSGASDTLLLAIAGPVIAGTSLFGGRGTVWSALLGALVIGSISNGIDLLGLSSDVRFMITGAVLLVAVTIDALARRRRQQAGRR